MNIEIVIPEPLQHYLNEHGLTIIDIHWYGAFSTYGIVSTQCKYTGEIKHRLGQCVITNTEDQDILHILKTGSKFYPEQFKHFI